ncbi:hypothetical protein U1Q18_032194 [Sarracenia purpurea var. burkii]
MRPTYPFGEGCDLFFDGDLEHALLYLAIPYWPNKLTMGNNAEHVSYAWKIAFARSGRSEMERSLHRVPRLSEAESDLPQSSFHFGFLD